MLHLYSIDLPRVFPVYLGISQVILIFLFPRQCSLIILFPLKNKKIKKGEKTSLNYHMIIVTI